MASEIKIINCEMAITRRAKNENHKSTYSVRFELSADTGMGDLEEFIAGMRKIWNKAVNAKRESDKTLDTPDFTMEITEHVIDKANNWETQKFNRWYTYDFNDVCTEKGEEGIYLRPDTKYTPETRDMLVGKDILRDLAFTMG